MEFLDKLATEYEEARRTGGYVKCDSCQGSGGNADECSICGGSGRLYPRKRTDA